MAGSCFERLRRLTESFLELPAEKRDLIKLVQFLHELLTDDSAFDFRLAHLLNALLDPVGHGFDRGCADGPFFAGLLQT